MQRGGGGRIGWGEHEQSSCLAHMSKFSLCRAVRRVFGRPEILVSWVLDRRYLARDSHTRGSKHANGLGGRDVRALGVAWRCSDAAGRSALHEQA